MYIGIEDETLTTYKEKLLGNLTGAVQRATQLGKSTPRKLCLRLIDFSACC